MSSQLEARAHGDRDALPPPWDIDPLATPALRRALPGIDAGFDAAGMTARLQSALFGTGVDAPVVESCEPGKAMYLGDEGCRIRYDLTVREPSSGRTRRRLVLGRLLATEDQAAAHLDVAPAARRLRRRAGRGRGSGPPHRAPGRPGDGRARLSDRRRPAGAGTGHRSDGDGTRAGRGLGGTGATAGWRVETGHYGRRHRCVLRYERDAGRAPVPTVVYGKLCWDRSGAQLVDGFADLQAAMAGSGAVAVAARLPAGARPQPARRAAGDTAARRAPPAAHARVRRRTRPALAWPARWPPPAGSPPRCIASRLAGVGPVPSPPRSPACRTS